MALDEEEPTEDNPVSEIIGYVFEMIVKGKVKLYSILESD